jgi:hypothetical protein
LLNCKLDRILADSGSDVIWVVPPSHDEIRFGADRVTTAVLREPSTQISRVRRIEARRGSHDLLYWCGYAVTCVQQQPSASI